MTQRDIRKRYDEMKKEGMKNDKIYDNLRDHFIPNVRPATTEQIGKLILELNGIGKEKKNE